MVLLRKILRFERSLKEVMSGENYKFLPNPKDNGSCIKFEENFKQASFSVGLRENVLAFACHDHF